MKNTFNFSVRNKKYDFLFLTTIFLIFLFTNNLIAVTYGGSGANNTFYSATPLILADGDEAIGFADLAGGFHTGAVDTSVTFTNVPITVANDIYLRSGAHINFIGDLTLSTTSIAASGSFMINGSGNTLFLTKDTTLPAQTITLASNLTIDGKGHTLTFNSSTVFSGGVLTLKNMIIKGLTGSAIFTNVPVVLHDCIIDIPSGTTFISTNNNSQLSIKGTVIIQGGGTFKVGNGANTYLVMYEYSTLYVDHDTTLEYASTNQMVNMDAAPSKLSTIHLNGGTLKVDSAVATSGMMMYNGRLFFENKCTLDNGSNSDSSKGFILGTATTANDLTVKVLAGACVQVNGYVWHNPGVAV